LSQPVGEPTDGVARLPRIHRASANRRRERCVFLYQLPIVSGGYRRRGPPGRSAPSCLVSKPSGIIEMDKHTGPAETCLLPPANAIRHPKRILITK
jgi:hypothetical protein